MSGEITPFLVQVPESQISDLRDRLRRTRWPERETVHDWSQGVPLGYLRELCGYWADGYDWRATEARLNELPQFRTEIDGLDIHFIHLTSRHAGALPLILTHGWPGSVAEFAGVVGPLADAGFHVVCPSLPGYGFSGKPSQPGWGVQRIATAWAELMARLGYRRYGAAGTDWGTSVSATIGRQDAAHVAGVHLIPPLAGPDPATSGDHTPAERAALNDLRHFDEWESGYSMEHATKPQTIGYALTDSPRRAVRLDRREVPLMDGPVERHRSRRPARQRVAVLVHRHRRVRGPAVLGEHPPGQRVDLGRGARHGERASRLHRIPARAAAAVPPLGRAPLHRHPLLERAGRGRSLPRT
jgi:pimeloyl-ACP methyl ester carboxylesterase